MDCIPTRLSHIIYYYSDEKLSMQSGNRANQWNEIDLTVNFFNKTWWLRKDSNLRHSSCQACMHPLYHEVLYYLMRQIQVGLLLKSPAPHFGHCASLTYSLSVYYHRSYKRIAEPTDSRDKTMGKNCNKGN